MNKFQQACLKAINTGITFKGSIMFAVISLIAAILFLCLSQQLLAQIIWPLIWNQIIWIIMQFIPLAAIAIYSLFNFLNEKKWLNSAHEVLLLTSLLFTVSLAFGVLNLFLFAFCFAPSLTVIIRTAIFTFTNND